MRTDTFMKGLQDLLIYAGAALFIVLAGYGIAMGGIMAGMALMALPIAGFIILLLLKQPSWGMVLILALSFIINGLGRYVEAPFGTALDGLMFLTFAFGIISLRREEYDRAANTLTFLLLTWLVYTIIEIFNPEAPGIEAWFFAVRSVSINMIFLVVLTFLVFYRKKDLNLFLIIWCIGGIISALYAIKQDVLGLSHAETVWVTTVGADTHLLFGQLRIFSFYSDAGQFGAFMAFTTVIAGVLAVKAENMKLRILYIATAILCAYGMLISGTRGSFFVLSGFLMYLLLTKNFRVFFIGLIFLAFGFAFLKYTHIGSSNYDIYRMRSALNPSEDPSFQVRLENQRKFAEYLSTRPFGGGIGSSAYWGQRFKPGSFLAETAVDSWYVRIWAETGKVGLVLYLGIFILAMIIAFIRIINLEDPMIKQKLMAIYAGCFGILVASYGNQLIGQLPTSVYFSVGMAYLFLFSDKEHLNKMKDEIVLKERV